MACLSQRGSSLWSFDHDYYGGDDDDDDDYYDDGDDDDDDDDEYDYDIVLMMLHMD